LGGEFVELLGNLFEELDRGVMTNERMTYVAHRSAGFCSGSGLGVRKVALAHVREQVAMHMRIG
jgi:hypothetical protein